MSDTRAINNFVECHQPGKRNRRVESEREFTELAESLQGIGVEVED